MPARRAPAPAGARARTFPIAAPGIPAPWNRRCLIASVRTRPHFIRAIQGAIMNEISAVRTEPSAPDTADATGLIRGLGWFGVTLGVAELAVPRLLASAIGVDRDGPAPAILRAMGVREIASSAAVLVRPDHPA